MRRAELAMMKATDASAEAQQRRSSVADRRSISDTQPARRESVRASDSSLPHATRSGAASRRTLRWAGEDSNPTKPTTTLPSAPAAQPSPAGRGASMTTNRGSGSATNRGPDTSRGSATACGSELDAERVTNLGRGLDFFTGGSSSRCRVKI